MTFAALASNDWVHASALWELPLSPAGWKDEQTGAAVYSDVWGLLFDTVEWRYAILLRSCVPSVFFAHAVFVSL